MGKYKIHQQCRGNNQKDTLKPKKPVGNPKIIIFVLLRIHIVADSSQQATDKSGINKYFTNNSNHKQTAKTSHGLKHVAIDV